MKMKLIKKKEVIDMKLMIASDIHGSAFYCEKMIEAYKREGQTGYYCLGIFFIMDRGMISRRDMHQKK